MHPGAGGPPVVVENFVRESIKLGHPSEIISTPLFCDGDESILLQRLNELAPTTFLSRSRAFAPVYRSTRRQLGESIRTADIIHVHTLWNPLNAMVRRGGAGHSRPFVLIPPCVLYPYPLTRRRLGKVLFFFFVQRQKNFLAAAPS